MSSQVHGTDSICVVLNTIHTSWHLSLTFYTYQPFECGYCEYRLYTSESDVCRRQIMTLEDDPRTERSKIFIMVGDP